VEWEQLPNGKWRPKNVFKKSLDGKYDWDDPRYKNKQKKALKETVIWCELCLNHYNLLEPCIHHLPDRYENYKIKKEYYKKTPKKESFKSLDSP